jgi:hypothetical protein
MRKYIATSGFLLSAAFVALLAGFLSAQENAFVYNDHGRRDPFWPLVSTSGTILVYDESIEISDMTLEGIIFDPQGERLAIINSKIVKVSDHIGGFLVSSIEQDKVILKKEETTFVLKLKKE